MKATIEWLECDPCDISYEKWPEMYQKLMKQRLN